MNEDLKNRFFNKDCIAGCRAHIPDDVVDLIVTDPPYGIGGDTLHKHYNRKEAYVLDGYIEIPQKEYAAFSEQWICEAARILRPGGSMYIVSGYTNLGDILNALKKTNLREINHIIWKYNFGVHTSRKFVSSHYHILYYEKPGGRRTFNTEARFGATEKDGNGGSLNYRDREDVWIINREYKPGQIKNKNELPKELLVKILQYSSKEGDLVCDLFLGSFSTAKVAIGLNRYATGFEKSKVIYDYQIKAVKNFHMGYLLPSLRRPAEHRLAHMGKPWSDGEMTNLRRRFQEVYHYDRNKERAIAALSEEFGRGRFAILNALKNVQVKSSVAPSLFDRVA